MRNLPIFIILLFPLSNNAESSQIEFQSFGFVGIGHVFYSQTFFKKHTLSVGAGYVPKSSTHDDMNLFSVKYRYSMDTKYFFNVKDIPITWRPYSFSFTFLQGKDHDVYKTFPDNTPKDYYAATDQRLLFSMQTNFIIPNNIELYWDWSVLDIGLISYLRNYQFYQDNYSFLGLTGIVNVGVGFRVNL